MQIDTMNATEDDLWRWFKIPDTDAEVELRLVTRDDLTQIAKTSDLTVQARTVAKGFFRDFRNMKDRRGEDIPNTEANRVEMLKFRRLFVFVMNTLMDVSRWSEEGKDGSGSGS
jgi:hypothetical protein